MGFEFDRKKSQANKSKHGISFLEAMNLWNDPYRLVIPARSSDENRWMMIAQYQKKIWSVIYTLRKNNIRIISARKARENEKEIYNH